MPSNKQIKKQAKQILDKFSKALSKIELKEKPLNMPVSGFREEKTGNRTSEKFKKQMFKNAPDKDGDFIISEKKKW